LDGDASEQRQAGERARRLGTRAARITVLTYLGAILMSAALADGMIFFPPPPSYDDQLAGLVQLTTVSGETVAAHLRVTEGAALTVLFAHGNAEDLGDGLGHSERYARLGVNTFAFDYPGYGSSTGQPSEDGAYEAADAAYAYLVDTLGFAPNSIIAHGRSLGGGVLVDLASRSHVGGLVIESSFVSAYRVVTRIPMLPIDQFKSLAKMSAVQAPVLVIHGDRDEVIPMWHGKRLHEAVPEDRRSSLWVEGAGHNDLTSVAGARYWDALEAFVNEVELRRGEAEDWPAQPPR